MIRQAILPRPILMRLRANQASSPDHEICGLLRVVREGGAAIVQDATLLPNRARSPRRAFRIRRQDLAARAAPWAVEGASAGVFHSHPHGDALPSLLDCASMRLHPGLWLIIARSETRAYWSENRSIRAIRVSVAPDIFVSAK